MQEKFPRLIKWMKSLCCMSKWEDFVLIALAKQKLRRDVIAMYKHRLERGSVWKCIQRRKAEKRAAGETASAEKQMQTMYLEIKVTSLSQGSDTWKQPLRKDYSSKFTFFVKCHGTLHWPQCCRQNLLVHNASTTMAEKKLNVFLIVTANEISQKLVMNEGLSNGSP